MMKPLLSDDTFLEDIAQATQTEPDNLHLWWLVQSGFFRAEWVLRCVPRLENVQITALFSATEQYEVKVTGERATFVPLVLSSGA